MPSPSPQQQAPQSPSPPQPTQPPPEPEAQKPQQATEPVPTPPPPSSSLDVLAPRKRFTRGQAVGLGLLSAVPALGSLGVRFLPGPTVDGSNVSGYYAYGTEALASVPLFAVSVGDGAMIGGTQLALGGGAAGLRTAANHDSTYKAYSAAMDIFSLHQALWAAYATYRDARLQADENGWSGKRPWQSATADQLMIAPVLPKNLAQPVVWAPVVVGISSSAILVGGYLPNHPVPRTAARDAVLAPFLALDVGVTEEALSRGLIYEELQESLGRWPARLIDMAIFAGLHVPGEIAADLPAEQIGQGLFARALFAMLADIAYDQGGLSESVALHVLWDFVLLEAQAFTAKPIPGSSNMLQFGSGGGRSATAGGGRDGTVMVPILSGRF